MRISEFVETIRIALDSLKANKLRSLLASLGVVIGISFVIIMGWILSGLDTVMQDTFNIIGVDMLYVDKWDWAGGKNWSEIRNRSNISIEESQELIDRHQSAEIIIPLIRRWAAQIKYNNNSYTGLSVSGTTYKHSLTPAGETIAGRHFSALEDQIGANVIVLGYNVYDAIFEKKDAIGKYIKLNGRKYLVIGVISKQGTLFFDMIDNQCFIPYKSFLKSFGDNQFRSVSIAVKAGGLDKLDEVRFETHGLMRQIRNLEPNEEDDFSINETKAFEKNIESIRLGVWGVGIGMTILSFIVGIIGIMNIMFVSVTERTKEIGIRKALGAKNRTILFQFITESATLCIVGAFISFIFCSLLVYLVATILPNFIEEFGFLKPFLPMDLLIIATIVSLIVGVVAGFIPALRAAKLDPVDSLRYE